MILALVAFGIFIACTGPGSKAGSPNTKTDKPQADIPQMILTRFGAIYPKAESPEWKLGQNGTFEVGFNQDQMECIVTFLPNGMVQQTEVKANVAALPAAANTFITEKLGVQKIDGASKVVDGFGTLTWKARIHDVDYLFTSDGQLIGKTDVTTGKEATQ